MTSRRISVLVLVLLALAVALHPERVAYTLGGFAAGCAFVASLPWFAAWLERWVERAGAGAAYWCKRCRVGTKNPLCWSCRQRDKTERSARRGAEERRFS